MLSIHSIFFQSVFASILDSNLVMWTGIFFVVVCFARLDDCRRSVDEDKYFEIFIDCIPPMGPMQTRLCNSDDGDYSTLRAVLQLQQQQRRQWWLWRPKKKRQIFVWTNIDCLRVVVRFCIVVAGAVENFVINSKHKNFFSAGYLAPTTK